MDVERPQIHLQSYLEAPPSEVWKVITDKELVSQWLMPTNIEPRKGFKCYFKMKPVPGFDGNIKAEVLDVVENERFTFNWEGGWMKKPTTVRFTLEARNGGTLLTLEHWGFEGFMGVLLRGMMRPGWKKMITKRIPALLKRTA